MKVPQVDLNRQHKALQAAIDEALHAVISSNQFILGDEVTRFEEDMTAYLSSTGCVGCANGTDAIELALLALGVGPGDEVITTPFTYFGSVSPIIRVGATPVFADIEADSMCLDPESVRERLTDNTRVILPVHLYGQGADMPAILDIAADASIMVVEDAAQAIGTMINGAAAGTLGDVGTFSFYPVKNLGAMGDGGMVTARSTRVLERVRTYGLNGEKEKYRHHLFGRNSRLDAIQAAVLRRKLPHLQDWTQQRRSAAARYNMLFTEAGLSPEPVTLPATRRDDGETGLHTFHQYTIRVDNRQELRAFLQEKGVGTAVHYPDVAYRQPVFSENDWEVKPCPEAEAAAARVISLPMFAEITEEEQHYVVDCIREYYS